MKRFLLPFTGLLALPAAAQSLWQGSVVDEAARPVPFANVVALSLPDSAIVAGGLCEADGRFSLRVPASARLLRLSSAGFATRFVPADSLTAGPRPFALEADGSFLGEATVTATRPVARLVGDALVTGVENTLLAKAGSAEDVLARVPGIIKKQEGLEVVGRGTPLIYINGRQLRDQSELSQLSSADIKSVEVIQNPGARYDATVTAVVRIRTVKRQGEGISADAKAEFRQGKDASGNGQLDLNYRHGQLDVFANVSYSHNRYNWVSTMEQDVYVDHHWAQRNEQDVMNDSEELEGTVGFNYDFNEHRAVGLRYTVGRETFDKSYGTFNGDIYCDGLFYDRLENNIESRDRHDPTHKLNVYYADRIGRGELNVDADFYADGTTNEQVTDEHSQEQDNRLVVSSNPVSSRIVAAKAQYALPLGGGRLSFGGQFTATDRRDDYLVPVEDYGIATSYSRLKEQNLAAFAEYARPVGRWQLTAGLRYEHVNFDYLSQGVRQPGQCRDYSNLFPSLSAATALGQVQFMASYTVKTSRPAYYQLSNNTTYANRYLMQSGNPTLRPTITHNLTLMGVWRWMQAVVTFKHDKDMVMNWGTSLPENPSATKLYQINKDIPNLMVSLTAAPKIGLWQPSWTAVFIRHWLKMEILGAEKDFDNPIFVGSWNNAFDLPAGLTANLDFTYQSKGNYQTVYLANPRNCNLGCSLRKSFFGDALSVTVGARDILRQMGNVQAKMHTYQTVLMQSGRGDTRQFYVTLRYRFNPARSKYKGRGAADEEIHRL